MTLSDALKDINVHKYYKMCGYSYHRLYHSDYTYNELPYIMKAGIVEIINSLYRIQKMTYSYDYDFVKDCLKKSCVKIKPFLKSCGLQDWFYQHPSFRTHAKERLMMIRQGIIEMINRLFNFINYH